MNRKPGGASIAGNEVTMTVAELIEELKKFPQDLPVEVGCVDGGGEEFEIEDRSRYVDGSRYVNIHHY